MPIWSNSGRVASLLLASSSTVLMMFEVNSSTFSISFVQTLISASREASISTKSLLASLILRSFVCFSWNRMFFCFSSASSICFCISFRFEAIFGCFSFSRLRISFHFRSVMSSLFIAEVFISASACRISASSFSFSFSSFTSSLWSFLISSSNLFEIPVTCSEYILLILVALLSNTDLTLWILWRYSSSMALMFSFR